MGNSIDDHHTSLSRMQTVVLAAVLALAYMAFGMLFGLMPQIYPEEAHRRGAVSAEVKHAFSSFSTTQQNETSLH